MAGITRELIGKRPISKGKEGRLIFLHVALVRPGSAALP
jgi:hypothetical protein